MRCGSTIFNSAFFANRYGSMRSSLFPTGRMCLLHLAKTALCGQSVAAFSTGILPFRVAASILCYRRHKTRPGRRGKDINCRQDTQHIDCSWFFVSSNDAADRPLDGLKKFATIIAIHLNDLPTTSPHGRYLDTMQKSVGFN